MYKIGSSVFENTDVIKNYCRDMLNYRTPLNYDFLISLSKYSPSVGYKASLYGANGIIINNNHFNITFRKHKEATEFSYNGAINNLKTKEYSIPAGSVYFIATNNNQFIKIGFSENPKRRLADLQVSNPLKLRIVQIIPGTTDDEKILHSLFSKTKTPSGNEWFSFSNEIKNYISFTERWKRKFINSNVEYC